MSELCQCGHSKDAHTKRGQAISDNCLGCFCPRFTPPVDEREKADVAYEKYFDCNHDANSPSYSGYPMSVCDVCRGRFSAESFHAGWNARSEQDATEVERLKAALKQILEKKSMGWEVTSEIARHALEEK